MEEALKALQITISVLAILAQAVMLFGIVYAFKLLIPALKSLVEPPKTSTFVQVLGVTSSESAAAENPPVQPEAVPEVKPVEAPKPEMPPRYKCKCKARLPEEPLHSRIEGESTILVYKCGRCGKEQEIDPSKATVTEVTVTEKSKPVG